MSEAQAPERPFVAGMYDYYLGGTANSAVDRAAVEQIRALLPELGESAWANRGFLQRAVRWLAMERGIRQFIDLGAGLPTQRHVHEVAAEVAPDARVVYVDNDPRVITRGQEILRDVPNAVVVLADIKDPESVFEHAETRRLLDFNQPVGLLMVAVTQFILDTDEACAIIGRYLDALTPGSYLAISAPTGDNQSEVILEKLRKIYERTPTPATERTRAEVERFFEGLEIVPPYAGAPATVCHVGQWGAEDPGAADDDGSRWFWAGVGRKP